MKTSKCTSANERFHASGGVCPQKHLWEFGSLSPARTFVPHRLREATTTLGASGESVVEKVTRPEKVVLPDNEVVNP
jgi:hypothetical protein